MPSTHPGAMRPHRLHTALAVVLACAARPIDGYASPPPRAVTTVVANCNDSGTGSLREAVTSAASGETIDLSQLGCSRITLTTGALATAVDDLTLAGPGVASLTIDGTYNAGQDIVFHLGHGTLDVEDMTLTGGFKYHAGSAARGGCIYSIGSVTLNRAVLANCEARSTGAGNAAQGGAVYAAQDLTMIDSVISDSRAGNADDEARGGGLYVHGSLIAKYSTIADSEAVKGSGGSLGGGAFVYKQALILNSTLSGNRAWHAGAMFAGRGAAYPVEIDNSTITDNETDFGAWAGVFANANTKVQNSTIAFNHATSPTYGGAAGVGLHVQESTLDIESSIISNNTNQYGPSTNDLVVYSGTLVGTNNLIVSSNVPVPPGTLSADPRLGPLRNNGGLTRTRMPMPGSPVIDAGNNVQGTTVDQRGTGYPRTIGAAPDIGAVEFSNDDDLFWDGFDGR